MATVKRPKIGVYGPKTRDLQKRLSYESVSLTWKTCFVYRYLGPRTEASPSIYDIQDKVLFETPDRAYDTTPVELNVWHEMMQEKTMDFSQFGLISPLGNEYIFRFHSLSFEEDGLGRYMIPGDIFEVPFFEQDGKKAFFEVTDVDRKAEFEKFYVVVTAVPMDDKRETAEIADKNINSSIMDDLRDGFDAEVEEQNNISGVDVGDYIVDDGDDEPEPYDPRAPEIGDFLDNPDKKIF